MRATRSLLPLAFLSFFFLVPPAFAQTAPMPHPNYCGPNSADKRLFTGIQYEAGAPKITLAVDPDFERDILRGERKITGDILITPIYDLVVTIVPTINEYCLPQWDKNGILVEKVDPPETMKVIGEITMTENGQRVVVRKNEEEPFVRGAKNEQGQWQYAWKMENWPAGVAYSDRALNERFIKAIANGQAIEAVVKVPKADSGEDIYSSQVGMSLCAPISGGGQYGVVYMRGESADYNLRELAAFGDGVWGRGFRETEPFATYHMTFSHFLDLGNYDDRGFETEDATINDKPRKYFKDISFPQRVSACSGKRLYIFINDLTYYGYTSRFTNNIFMAVDGFSQTHPDGTRTALVSEFSDTAMHEIGHAFAGLNDEYLVNSNISVKKSWTVAGNFVENCSLRPLDDFTYNTKSGNKLYGSLTSEGCTFRAVDFSGVLRPLYRPTEDSIMREGTGQFNVVSCGHIVTAIIGFAQGIAESHFPDCWELDGIVDKGVKYELPKENSSATSKKSVDSNSDLLSAVGNFTSSIFGSGVASVQTAVNNDYQYLMMDSFDPQDRWGALIELDKDGNMTGPMIENGTTPTSSPTKTPVTSISKSSFARNGIAKFFLSIATGVQAVYSNTVETITSVIYKPVTTPSSSATATPVPVASPTNKNTISPSITAKPTISPSASFKPAPTTYRSPSPSVSTLPTVTSTPDPSVTNPPSPSYVPTYSVTPTVTITPSPSTTVPLYASPSQTFSPSPTVFTSPITTVSPTNSPSPISSVIPTATPTSSSSPLPTSTVTPSPSLSPSTSVTPSPSSSPQAFLEGDRLMAGVLGALKVIFWVVR
ncbi:MAG: hypothetical protein WCT02_01950 [Candidatus Paceibacterota bacterium]